MAPAPSYYWYDLETSGIDPRWHRVMQFGGIRTDLDLNEVGDELNTYVKLPIDVLPDPFSCAITGLTPQLVNEKGIDELEFHSRIDEVFSTPNTCVAGFNNLRFDDEFMRYGFYRHLIDPYAREWRNGNSRWDVIDLLRAAYALRPDGLHWPRDPDGLPTFRLEALSTGNSIEHLHAHDAFSDVRATIGLARQLKLHQPRLFAFYLSLRHRNEVRRILSVGEWRMCLHVSGRFAREQSCLAPVVAISPHPHNSNSVIVADLSKDVAPLVDWDAERIRETLFARGAPERPGLKEVRMNRCPFVAPFNTLRPQDRERLGLDVNLVNERLDVLRRSPDIVQKIVDVYTFERDHPPADDADAALYQGFWSDGDRARCTQARAALRAGASVDLKFDDERLPELVRRIRARVSFGELSVSERSQWLEYVEKKLTTPRVGMVDLGYFRGSLPEVSDETPKRAALVSDLVRHAHEIGALIDSVDLRPTRGSNHNT